MLLSAVSVLVVAQSSSEIPEGLMNNPVFNDRIWCTLKATLRYRPACTECRGNAWELRKVIWLELDGFVSSAEGRNGAVSV